MKITKINAYRHQFGLKRPYKIAYKTQTTAENVIVEVHTNKGKIGFGAAAPSFEVTKETFDGCLNALNPDLLNWCYGQDLRDFPRLRNMCFNKLKESPAACAALDMALHDLIAQIEEKPLVDLLGRVHHQLPTSITIGIKNLDDTLIEAMEYYDRGFKILKVKLGASLEEDIARLIKLREQFGNKVTIRVDPNQGYSFSDLKIFLDSTKDLSIEFIEQPLKTTESNALLALSDQDKKKIALDESILTANDSIQALMPSPRCGIFNIKLMKCGGIYAAQKIATIAEAAKIDLMWGCMDESIISISAALHVALSSPATRYLDLDGSLDLIHDVVQGGFELKEGVMQPLALPGLGVQRIM